MVLLITLDILTKCIYTSVYTWVLLIASNTKGNSKKEIYIMGKESGGRPGPWQAHLTPVLVLCISIGLLSFQSQAGGIIWRKRLATALLTFWNLLDSTH